MQPLDQSKRRFRPGLSGTRRLSPGYFALVMATGIVSIASDKAGFHTIAVILLWLNAVQFVVLWFLTSWRLLRYRREVIADLTDHRTAPQFLSAVAATGVMANQLMLAGAFDFALGLWFFGIFLWITLTYTIFANLTVTETKPTIDKGITGAWLLAVVSTQAIALLSAAGDPAYDLWKSRYEQMSTAYAALKAIPVDGANAPTGFARMVKDSLGFEVTDLEELDAESQAGRGVENRLAQLNLAYGAFSYLMKILRLAQSPQPLITAAEWDTVYATLLRAKTQLASAALRADENDNGITLSPDLFKVPASLTTLSAPVLGPVDAVLAVDSHDTQRLARHPAITH